jgi:hypothetical protein
MLGRYSYLKRASRPQKEMFATVMETMTPIASQKATLIHDISYGNYFSPIEIIFGDLACVYQEVILQTGAVAR